MKLPYHISAVKVMLDSRFNQFKRKVLRTVALTLALLALVNSYGTIGLMLLENASFFDSFYMTVISITTVGYRETIILSEPGRLFMISVIFAGLLSTGFSIALISNLFFEETMSDILKGHGKEKRLKKVRDHYIVCGYGTTGRGIADELMAQGEAVVVIDLLDKSNPSNSPIFIDGDARVDEVLVSAGIGRAKGLASTLTEDADNVFVVLTARALNPDLTIVSRFKDEGSEKKLLTAGADKVVSPYRMGGHHLALSLTNPHFVQVLDATFSNTDMAVHFTQLTVPPGSQIRNLQMWDYIRNHTLGALIVAITDEQEQTTFNPDPEMRLSHAVKLLALGDDAQIDALRDFIDQKGS